MEAIENLHARYPHLKVRMYSQNHRVPSIPIAHVQTAIEAACHYGEPLAMS